MTVVTPVWVWLPGRDEPTRAGELVSGNGARFIYRPDYARTAGALALDPVELRISRSSRGTAVLGADGLPGVVRDAKPAGYGEDRLKAIHGDHLDALQLLELGVPDGVGAIEACNDIERKLQWRPRGLADRLRIWTRDGADDHPERLGRQRVELWKRMAFNALVGNTDDHALNTGLLFDRVAEGSDRMAWGLSPAFDITPNVVGWPSPIADGPPLSLATGTDGRSGTSVARLADAAQWMGLERDDAIQWLMNTARQVAGQWAPMLRAAAGPIIEDATRLERLVGDVRQSFAYAEWLAQAS